MTCWRDGGGEGKGGGGKVRFRVEDLGLGNKKP